MPFICVRFYSISDVKYTAVDLGERTGNREMYKICAKTTANVCQRNFWFGQSKCTQTERKKRGEIRGGKIKGISME
jgi:hypothetical protein